MSCAHRCIILGGGIAGVALAHALAERGAGEGVLLLEREPALGHHSTGRNAAILRSAIAAPATRALALETGRFLRRPPAGFAPVPLLEPVGLIVREGVGSEPEPPWLAEHLEAGEVERLSATDLSSRAPFLSTSGASGERAWWFPGAGRIDVSALLEGFATGARRGGVEIRTNARGAALLTEGQTVRGVSLADGTVLAAACVVVAAGGWAGAIGGSPALRDVLAPTRRHLLVTAFDARVDPRWPIVWDDRAGFYARPESGGWLVCGCDQEPVDPERCAADPEARIEALVKLGRHLPAFADACAAHAWAGVRTVTPDDTPLVGPDPERPGLFWLAGLGGHGISVSAAAGRLAADLLLGAAHPLADAVAPARFASASRAAP